MAEQEIEIKHFIPGRARFKVPAIRHSPSFATRLRETLSQLPGVRSVELTTASASVLVLFEPSMLRNPQALEQLFGTLQGLFPTLDTAPLRQWLRAAGLTG